MRKYLILFFTLLFHLSIYSQLNSNNYQIHKSSYEYILMDSVVNIDNYSIVNTCDDYLWAWFDKKDSLYTQKDIIRYFFGNKEDFNLIKILTDEFSVYTPITVYSFFIKRVAPGESFDIVFTGINTPKETIDIKLDEVLKTLRIYKENDLSNIIKGIESLPRYQGRKAVFYEHNSIIFPLSVF